jgi:AraC-like DNA-binding protein
MVSLRCKMVVKEELKKLKIVYRSIDLGVVEIEGSISSEEKEILGKNLREFGLELLDDKKNILVEKIKAVIIEMVHYVDDVPKVNDSDYISEKLGYDYTYLSNTFSKVKGVTNQHYIIMHKIERAKEFLLYNELTLTEIADKLNYSSVAHLSNQFKKVTGLTPSYFKELKKKRSDNLEDL